MQYRNYSFEIEKRGFGFVTRVTDEAGRMYDVCRKTKSDYQRDIEPISSGGQLDHAAADEIIGRIERGTAKETPGGFSSRLNQI